MFVNLFSPGWLERDTHPDTGHSSHNWASLKLLNIYRLFLIVVLLASPYYMAPEYTALGQRDAVLFSSAILSYLGTSLVFAGLLYQRWPQFEIQVNLQVYIDILAITILMHASGGISSGLGMLLVATIAGTGLIIVDRVAVLFAAIATLAILAEQLYTQLTYGSDQTSFMPAGILGATLIATALLATVLARRNRESEALARQRKADFDNLAELNEQIIQQMKSGLLFVNSSGQILVANGSARQLLDIPNSVETPNLWTTSKPLASALTQWQKTPSMEQSPIIDRKLDIELQPHFLPLGEMGTLIRVEDNSELKGQLQQLKLASLGRLTASIAHEIRNPLGAISHAAQLLEESDSIDENEMRLTRIVIEQSQRMNRIIEDVLQLSRRQRAEPHKIGLLEDLTKFAEHFCIREKLQTDAMHVTVPRRINVYMDPNHLHQILWNLCSNSMRHGGRDDIVIDLAADFLGRGDNPYLEIRDNGVGIQPEKYEEIFEPFYTTSHDGTGLGLYIARELCELNDARLELRRSDGGSCFRMVFSPPPDSAK